MGTKYRGTHSNTPYNTRAFPKTLPIDKKRGLPVDGSTSTTNSKTLSINNQVDDPSPPGPRYDPIRQQVLDQSPAHSDSLDDSEDGSDDGSLEAISTAVMLKPSGDAFNASGPSTVVVDPALHVTSSLYHNRRRAHIASEQKRRQNINEGFDDLRRAVPACINASDSKAVILRKAVNYIVQLQSDLARTKGMPVSTHIYPSAPYEMQRSHSPIGYPHNGAAAATRPTYTAHRPAGYPSSVTYSVAPQPFVTIRTPTHAQLMQPSSPGISTMKSPRLQLPLPNAMQQSSQTGSTLPPLGQSMQALPPLQIPYTSSASHHYNREDYASAASLSMLRQDGPRGSPSSLGYQPGYNSNLQRH